MCVTADGHDTGKRKRQNREMNGIDYKDGSVDSECRWNTLLNARRRGQEGDCSRNSAYFHRLVSLFLNENTQNEGSFMEQLEALTNRAYRFIRSVDRASSSYCCVLACGLRHN